MNNLHRQPDAQNFKAGHQDDIQEIILQAQKVYQQEAKYHETLTNSDDNKAPDHRSTDSRESPLPKKQGVHQNLEPKIMNNPTQRSKSPSDVIRDQERATKRSTNRGSDERLALKTRNHVLNSGQNSTDGVYLDTNLEEQEQVRNYTPEPFKQGPGHKGAGEFHKFAQLKEELDFGQQVTKLPHIKSHTGTLGGNNIANFARNAQVDVHDLNSKNLQKSTYSNERRVEQKHLESSRSMQTHGKKEISPINKYRIRRLEKSANARQQSEQYMATSKSRSNPSNKSSSIEAFKKPPQIAKEFNRQLDALNRKSSGSGIQTQFSKNFSTLYEKIAEVYPGFTKVATSVSIHPQLMPDDLLRAENVFNQLNFMYQKATKKGDAHNDTGNFGQTNKSTSALEFKLQNVERESHYYHAQLQVLQDQLQKAALREQQQEMNHEQRLEALNTQVKEYETRLDRMQFKLDQYQRGTEKDTQSQVSFRDTKPPASFKSWTNADNGTAQPSLDDPDAALSQLQFEINELKNRLQSREDQITFEKDNNQGLLDKINRMNEAFEAELTTYKKECSLLHEEIRHRENQAETLKQQVEQVSQTANLEFPIVITKDQREEKDNNTINLTNQRAETQDTKNNKFISMRKANQKAILDEFDLDLDQIMGTGSFEQDEIQLITNSFKSKPQKRQKSNGRVGKSPQPPRQQPSSFIQNVTSMFNLNDAFKSQITSVMAADEILKDIKKIRTDKLDQITACLDQNQRYHEKMETFTQQKEELAGRLKELTTENESLKHQFSQLLDQFQEYVNESEKKLEEEQYNQKAQQEQLLNDLNGTVQQLEDMSKQLQQEVQDKERQIEQMDEEHGRLSQELQDMRAEQQKLVDSEEAQRAQVKTLNEDLRYMKKQYLMEIEALRGENIHLHAKMREKSADTNNRRLQHQRSTSPYENEEGQTQIDKKYEESVIDAPEYSHFAETRLNRQSNSALIDYSKHKGRDSRVGSNTSNRDCPPNYRENRWKEQDAELQDTVYGGKEAFRSKSHDRALTGNEHASAQPKGTSFDLCSPGYEEKKRELLDKDRLIEQKNKEIVKLRMENDELREYWQNGSNDETKKKSRQQIYDEIDDFLENVKSELEKTKVNLFNKERSYSPQMRNFREQRNFTLVQTEDALLSALFEKTQLMRSIKALLGEVFLLSGQQRQYPAKPSHKFQNHSGVQAGMMKISEQEYQKMLQENSQLERMISHYEQTLDKLEVVCQNPNDQSALLDMKRVQQQQLQTISHLQNELNILQEQIDQQENQAAPNMPNSQLHKMQQESRVLRQEIQMLREVEMRAQNLKNGNDELMHERNQLLQKIDDLEQEQSDLNLQVQNQQLQIAERDAQLEELRTRITAIAELFEKKPIKQRYSFEVLCDFVHDKAKRLFAKYDNAVKDKKALQNDDKAGRKVYKLEQELQAMKDVAKFLRQTVLPSLAGMLNKEGHSEDIEQLNLQFARQLVLEVEYEFKQQRKELHDNSQTIQSNLQKIDSLQRALDQGSYPNRTRGASQDDQLRTMKQEKEQLNNKLDEFSQVLRDFQVNQSKFENENAQLKKKITQLEGNQTSMMDNYSNKHGNTNMMTSLGCAEPSIAGASVHSGYPRRNENLASSKGLLFNHTSTSGTGQCQMAGAAALGAETSPLKMSNPQ